MARDKTITWEEIDDLLTAACDVDSLIEAMRMAATDRASVSSDATDALQAVASAAQQRLRGMRQSLEGYMEDARS